MLQFLNSILLLPILYPGRLASRARQLQTNFRVFYNHSARTTSENTAYLLLCDVTAYVRMCLVRVARQRSVHGPKKTLLLYCQECAFTAPLPSNEFTCHNIKD
jgi:hypothetical protein